MVNWVSSLLSFFLSAFHCCYIYSTPTSTTTIITLEPYALNVSAFHAEIKISFLYPYLWKRGQRVTAWITLLHCLSSYSQSIFYCDMCRVKTKGSQIYTRKGPCEVHSTLIKSIVECQSEPAPTSPPSTGRPLLLSCGWTSTELIFDFTLVTNSVRNRSHI